MARNKLIDLSNHLYEQLERLNDDTLTPEQIKDEAARAHAMNSMATSIIKNSKLQLEAAKFASKFSDDFIAPKQFELNKEN